jgi:hypothetical protein
MIKLGSWKSFILLDKSIMVIFVNNFSFFNMAYSHDWTMRCRFFTFYFQHAFN